MQSSFEAVFVNIRTNTDEIFRHILNFVASEQEASENWATPIHLRDLRF